MPIIPAIIGAMRPLTITVLLISEADARPIPHFAVPKALPAHERTTPMQMPKKPKNGDQAGQFGQSSGRSAADDDIFLFLFLWTADSYLMGRGRF